MYSGERAFVPTEDGQIEIKTIPESKVIKSISSQNYFEANNLFMPLFWYITTRGIAMTTPVEVAVDPGSMYFYMGEKAAERDLKANKKVEVLTVPERLVASIAYTGAYSEANFLVAENKLRQWLEEQSSYKSVGSARIIYWDSPATPDSKKRAEVHISITEQN
jgi:effector-binding domain-containing protein